MLDGDENKEMQRIAEVIVKERLMEPNIYKESPRISLKNG
jgi:hypothetical protein